MKGLQAYMYCCEDCNVLFGVETKFDDQAILVCPVCKTDDHIEEVGLADVVMVKLTEDQEKGDVTDENTRPQ